MKIKNLYFILFSLIFLTACKKEEVLNANDGKVVNLDIKGYVMADTLQFVLNNTVIGQAIDADFKIDTKLVNANDHIDVRKRADKKVIGTITALPEPFNQVRKIFYDGQTLADNLQLTPVANPLNMGVRLRFSTQFKDFYGGPVDIEFYDEVIDLNTFEFTYTPVKKMSNVTGAFGEFFELPPLPEMTEFVVHLYAFRVFKAGTLDAPYSKMDNVHIDEPNYGTLDNFNAGQSTLLSINPQSDRDNVYSGYIVTDFADAFR